MSVIPVDDATRTILENYIVHIPRYLLLKGVYRGDIQSIYPYATPRERECCRDYCAQLDTMGRKEASI